MLPIIRNLVDIGVGYLNLNRATGSLSGGESQRVKMASQLGCDLVDMLYIFDESTVGLHQRDIGKLVEMLYRLRDKGNSLLVVEHDQQVMRASDWIIDVGPGAGAAGGAVVFAGTYRQLLDSDSITGQMLTRKTEYRSERRRPAGWIPIKDARVHNLKNVSTRIPTGISTCVTGVSVAAVPYPTGWHSSRPAPAAAPRDTDRGFSAADAPKECDRGNHQRAGARVRHAPHPLPRTGKDQVGKLLHRRCLQCASLAEAYDVADPGSDAAGLRPAGGIIEPYCPGNVE